LQGKQDLLVGLVEDPHHEGLEEVGQVGLVEQVAYQAEQEAVRLVLLQEPRILEGRPYQMIQPPQMHRLAKFARLPAHPSLRMSRQGQLGRLRVGINQYQQVANRNNPKHLVNGRIFSLLETLQITKNHLGKLVNHFLQENLREISYDNCKPVAGMLNNLDIL
jgi:hypothetical protein